MFSLRRQNANPRELILMGLPSVTTLSQIWNEFECTCAHGHPDRNCILYLVIAHIKRRSFTFFREFVQRCPDIGKSPQKKQTRSHHIKYTSKCLSGRFYRIMPKKMFAAQIAEPSPYTELEHCESDSEGTATEEMSEIDPPSPPENPPDKKKQTYIKTKHSKYLYRANSAPY